MRHFARMAVLLAAIFASSAPALAQSVGGAAAISATTTSASVAIPASKTTFPVLLLTPAQGNAVGLYYALGSSSVVATTSSPALPIGGICVAAGPNTYVAAITGSSTATLNITQMSQCPLFSGASPGGGGGGSGTVTSVGLNLPSSVFSISGSPVTGSGTLTGAFVTQTANTVFAGPTTGSAAAPAFRALVAADIPGTLGSTAIGAGSAITSSGPGGALVATAYTATNASSTAVVGSAGSSTNNYVPQWSGTAGNFLGAGLPVGLTGNSTIVETTSGGLLTASLLPLATTSTLGGVIVGTGLSVASGTVSVTNPFVAANYCAVAGGAACTMTGSIVGADGTAWSSTGFAAPSGGPIDITGTTQTGSSTNGVAQFNQTWNTSGGPVGVKISITNTASSNGLPFAVYAGSAGTTNEFAVDTNGGVHLAGLLTWPGFGSVTATIGPDSQSGLNFTSYYANGNGSSPYQFAMHSSITATTNPSGNLIPGGVSGIAYAPTFAPASGSANFSALNLNPTINATSSGVAVGFTLALVNTKMTGGTVYLMDIGTTTATYWSGYTSAFRVDTGGNIAASGALTLSPLTTQGILVNSSAGAVSANTSIAAATVSAAFAADHRLAVNIAGTTYYLAASTTAW
jgi:hypothetical protein